MKKLLAASAVLGLFVMAAVDGMGEEPSTERFASRGCADTCNIYGDEDSTERFAETCHKTGQPPKDTMFAQTEPSSESEHPC